MGDLHRRGHREADYRAAVEAAGPRVREVRQSTYAFATREAQEAAQRWGVHSIFLVADAG